MRQRFADVGVLALAATLIASATAGAQIASSPPAVCVPARAASVAPVIDSTMVTGVVVRFTGSASGQAGDAHLAKSMSARTADRLQALVSTPVRARYDVSADGDQKNDVTGAIAEGRVLGVRWVMTGRVERKGDTVLVSWNVIDSRSGASRGAGNDRDLLVRLETLSQRVALAAARRVGYSGAAPAPVATSPRSVRAFELYLAGQFEHDSFDPIALKRAVEALREATRIEPSMHPAWLTLAELLARLTEWGEGGTAQGRTARSRDALAATNRALALAPTHAHTLALLAHLHLLRDEPIAAQQVIDGLRRVAPTAEELSWLDAELAFTRGTLTGVDTALRNTRVANGLFLQADVARRRGDLLEACRALNRLLVLEPTWAPAYVQRSIVRSALADRRGGWQDAEMATRLGQPVWGELASALIDYSVSDSLRTRTRLKRVPAVGPSTVLPWLDVLLRGAVYTATGQPERAQQALAAVACNEPRRRYFQGDPLLPFLKVPPACRASVGSAEPAGQLAQ